MKTIVKRSEIIKLLIELNNNNSEDILPELVNKCDEEGKNPLIIALENKLYDQFYIMINPVPYLDTYKIYFDPFNISITQGKKALELPYDSNNYMTSTTYTFNTRTVYYSVYSAYNYIMNIKDEEVKYVLDTMCHEIDYDIIKTIPVKNIVKKQKEHNTTIYEEKDIIKYVDYELQDTFLELLNKNIKISNWGCTSKEAYISIKLSDLNEENQRIINELSKLGITTKDNDLIRISVINIDNATVESISITFKTIINMFKKQPVISGIVNINEYYKNIETLFKLHNIEIPLIETEEDKEKFCIKTNSFLTHAYDEFYYIHPALKDRDITHTLKKNQ